MCCALIKICFPNITSKKIIHLIMSNPNDIRYFFDQEELKYHIMIINWIGAIGISLVSLSMPLLFGGGGGCGIRAKTLYVMFYAE